MEEKHKSFRVSPSENNAWKKLFRITQTNKKESGYLAGCLLLFVIVIGQNFSNTNLPTFILVEKIKGLLTIGFIIYGIRWFYLIIKERKHE